jgi:outer membrane protein, heavy metal efflux system
MSFASTTGHVAIARQAVEAARIKYTVGKVPQQDILKAQVELTRLAEHLIHFEQDAEVARARLNTLLGHDPAAFTPHTSNNYFD